MSRYNIRKARPDAPRQPNDVRPRGEVYSADFLSAFWPEEERAKKTVPEPQTSAEMPRYNIRKPRADHQVAPTDRRPKSEVYSADFLCSFWPEEDKTKPKPTGRKVRKGARQFVEHDNSCQWIEYMKQPAEQPESFSTEPSDNTASSMFSTSAEDGYQQGDTVTSKPRNDATYLREQRLSCSPEKGTVYLKETAIRPRRALSPRKPATNDNKDKTPDNKPNQTSHEITSQPSQQNTSQTPEKGTVDWYQSQVSLLEEQQRQLMEQQQNLIAIMSNHRDLSTQQQQIPQIQTHPQSHQMHQPDQHCVSAKTSDSARSVHGGPVQSSDSVISTGDDYTLSMSHPDVVGQSCHVTSGVESDCSLRGECSNNNVSNNTDMSPQLHKLRQSSARVRKYEESRSRDIRLSMSGHMSGQMTGDMTQQGGDRDHCQFPERQRSNTSQCSRLSHYTDPGDPHSGDLDLPARRKSSLAMAVNCESEQYKELGHVSRSPSDVSHCEGGEDSVFSEPRRGIRLKGHTAAANAVKHEGNVDRIIYYRKKSASGEVEEPVEEAKIYDMNQPLERSKSSVKTGAERGLADRNTSMAATQHNHGSPHWLKARSSTSISDDHVTNPGDRPPASPALSHTELPIGATPFSRQATPGLQDATTINCIDDNRSVSSRGSTPVLQQPSP